MYRVGACLNSVLVALVLFAASAMGQTISPPIAEYRGKAQGSFELRNDGDVPLAVMLEVRGFRVSPDGVLSYVAPEPSMHVEFGNSSFTIPPRQSHTVFYKVKSPTQNAWFAILSTLTRAVPIRGQMRVNVVLPHIVYAYQKAKLKPAEVALKLQRLEDGSFRLEVANKSDKLSRVERFETKGFEKDSEIGGVPVFPSATRYITFAPGAATPSARVRVHFEDGFVLEVTP